MCVCVCVCVCARARARVSGAYACFYASVCVGTHILEGFSVSIFACASILSLSLSVRFVLRRVFFFFYFLARPGIHGIVNSP